MRKTASQAAVQITAASTATGSHLLASLTGQGMEMVDLTVVGIQGSTMMNILVVGGGRRVEGEEEGGCSKGQLVALPVEEQEQGTWVSCTVYMQCTRACCKLTDSAVKSSRV